MYNNAHVRRCAMMTCCKCEWTWPELQLIRTASDCEIDVAGYWIIQPVAPPPQAYLFACRPFSTLYLLSVWPPELCWGSVRLWFQPYFILLRNFVVVFLCPIFFLQQKSRLLCVTSVTQTYYFFVLLWSVPLLLTVLVVYDFLAASTRHGTV